MKQGDALSLPKGWEIKKLGEVCENLDSKRVPITQNKRKKGDIPYYGASGIVDYVSDYIFNEDLLCVSEDGANLLARTYPIAFPISGKTWVNNHAHVLRFPNLVSQKFVEIYLNSICVEDYVSGMAQPKLNQAMLNKINIPLPPLPEQQCIVSILDESFAAIAKAKANAEKNLKNAKELFESYLQGVFENGNWETKTIDMVCDEIFAGGDAPKNNFSTEPTEKHKIPIYANAVKDRGLYGYTDFARVTKPCVTISARGSGTGHTELRNELFLPIVRLIVCIPETNQMSTEFLKYTIDNLVIQRSGSAIPQLTVPMIKEYKIPVPTVEEQKQLIEKAETLRAETQKLEAIYQQKLLNLEELKKSILQKAFAGELKTEKALAV